jgi:hypothetical protein
LNDRPWFRGSGGNSIFNSQRLPTPFDLPSRGLLSLRVSRMVRRLTQSNLRSRLPVVRKGGPVVSLTSYGKRVETVHLTIESIASGRLLPSRLILWLDDADIIQNSSEPLIRLKERGLEVCFARDYGPHKKYYPYIESMDEFGLPLVTADDDVLYPIYWLERLVRAYEDRPDLINCYRARVVGLEAVGLRPYNDWPMCDSTEPTILNFATGVSGVLYPPEFLAALKQSGSAFESCCPRADDIWLHVRALRSGYKVRQVVRRKDLHFPSIPGTQNTALYHSNRQLGNDHQAAMTYSQGDLDTLRRLVRS